LPCGRDNDDDHVSNFLSRSFSHLRRSFLIAAWSMGLHCMSLGRGKEGAELTITFWDDRCGEDCQGAVGRIQMSAHEMEQLLSRSIAVSALLVGCEVQEGEPS